MNLQFRFKRFKSVLDNSGTFSKSKNIHSTEKGELKHYITTLHIYHRGKNDNNKC